MFNSLRVRLLVWQVMLLTAVLVSFGAVVFHQWRQNLFAELDSELLSSATVLEGTLRGAHGPDYLDPPRPNRRRPGQRPGGDRISDEVPAPTNGRRDRRDKPNDRRPRNRDSIGPPPPETTFNSEQLILAGDVSPTIFNLPHNLIVRRGRQQATYFVIYDINDGIIASSGDREFRTPQFRGRRNRTFRTHGAEREVMLMGPGRTRILVGRDTGDFNRRTTSFLMRLGLVGFGILSFGCLAGYWVTGRAIAPIHAVSQTVQSITGKNLSSRIDIAEMDTEFIQLSKLLNEMLDRLESTINQQQRFIADASHELRTPVAVIGMHSELALTQDRSPEQYKKTLEICMRTSQRLRSLTEDLLTLAKSDSQQLKLNKEKLDLCQLSKESVEFLQPLADEHHVNLSAQCDTPAIINGDRRLIRQLVDNLLTNAIIHNRPTGNATISANSTNDWVVLQVRDNGPGISEDKLEHLFDRFFRANESRSRESGGSGLGLSICQRIARLHRGDLAVESNPDVGTVFEFRIPHPSQQSQP